VIARARPLLTLWLPPLALMALIFLLSAQPDLSSGLGLVDLVGRKIVHAGEYALLCVLWWRSLRTVARPRAAIAAALAISVAYGVSDEIHQSFVPTRHGAPLDVAIDALGATLAALFIDRRSVRHRTAARPGTEPDDPPSPGGDLRLARRGAETG
jgi:hypothetical protein